MAVQMELWEGVVPATIHLFERDKVGSEELRPCYVSGAAFPSSPVSAPLDLIGHVLAHPKRSYSPGSVI